MCVWRGASCGLKVLTHPGTPPLHRAMPALREAGPQSHLMDL